MTEPRTRVMVADDDRTVRDALADLVSSQPGLELVGVAVDHPDAIRLAVRDRPRVVVLDVRMPGGYAAATVRAIQDQTPTTQILVLSAYEDPAGALDVLTAGAIGYLVKGVADEELSEAVARAARGQLSISAALARECLQLVRRHPEQTWRPEAATPQNVTVLRQLLDRVPDAGVLVGPGGHIELANARVQEMFGYRPADLLGERITALAPAPVAGEPADELVARLLAGPPPEEPGPEPYLTTVGRRRDGTEFPAEVAVSRLSGGLRGVAMYFRDLTAVRVVESRHQLLFESIPEATVVVDRSGTIQMVNTATVHLFGYPREDLIGRTVDALLPDHPVAIYRKESDEVPAEQGAGVTPVGLELVGRRRDGAEFPIDMSIGRVRTPEGMRVILSIRDMTETAGSRAVLEHSVEVLRAAGEEHRNLLVDVVRGTERERARIAAGIHDDSLQVITAASLRLQQLRRRLDDPDTLKILSKVEETIKLAAERLRRTIFNFRPPALQEEGVVAALRIYLDRMREETGVEYQLDNVLGEEPPAEIRAVLYRVGQEALMNVRKHARANLVRVRLSRADGGYLVEIVDNGVGYDPKRAEARPGHLGLTLMRDRTEMAGGWCRVESAPGAGTTVEYWLPREFGDGGRRSGRGGTGCGQGGAG